MVIESEIDGGFSLPQFMLQNHNVTEEDSDEDGKKRVDKKVTRRKETSQALGNAQDSRHDTA